MLRLVTALIIGDLTPINKGMSDKSLTTKAMTSHRTPYLKLMKRIAAQIRKELTQTFRDRLTMTLALILPVILLLLYAVAISLSISNISIGVIDYDQSPMSRRYVDTLRASLTFKIIDVGINQKPEDVLASRKARAVIIIPEKFEQSFTRNRLANVSEGRNEIQWLVDASDANTANILKGNAAALTSSYLIKGGGQGGGRAQSVKANIRLWYNPGRDSLKYIAPAALAVVLALFPPLLAALAMSREGEQKTILQVYVSGISAHEYLLGKILAFFIIASAEWLLVLGTVRFAFRLSLVGDPTPLLIGTIVYLFCNVCFGTLVGVAIPNQAAAILAVAVTGILLSMMMSGFIFPIENIPVGLRWISSIVPARYYIEITRDAFLRGGGWSNVWYAPLVLAAIGGFFFMVALRKLRKMQLDI